MGYFVYATVAEYEIDDRALAHLKTAISLKLRRQESFFVSWTNPPEKGSGRVSMWVSPSIPLLFRFSGSKTPELNPVWLDVLRDLSHTPRGLILVSEKEAEAYARSQAQAQKQNQIEKQTPTPQQASEKKQAPEQKRAPAQTKTKREGSR